MKIVPFLPAALCLLTQIVSFAQVVQTNKSFCSPCHPLQVTTGLFGSRFSSLQQNYELSLTNISVVDTNNLWVVGRERRADRIEKSVLLHTSDKGKTWQHKLVDSEKWFYEIYFIDSKIGWIAGHNGLILNSTDGGNSWTKQTAPTESNLIEIQFIEPSLGWIMGEDGELLKTTDGGKNWHSYRLNGHGWVTSNSKDNFQGWVFSFHFSDKFNGWIIGEKGKVYQSTDGGLSWRSRGDELMKLVNDWQSSQLEFTEVRFINPKQGFIAANVRTGEIDNQNFSGVIFKTEDGGHTWKYNVVNKGLGIGSIQFLNESEAWVTSKWGERLLYTRNGGKSWVELSIPSDGGASERVNFIDSKNGWLLVNYGNFFDGIFYTSDGGKTWIEWNLPGN